MTESLTAVRYIRHYTPAMSSTEIKPVYVCGEADPDRTRYILYRTFPQRVRCCVSAEVFEKLALTPEEAANTRAIPYLWKIREVQHRSDHVVLNDDL